MRRTSTSTFVERKELAISPCKGPTPAQSGALLTPAHASRGSRNPSIRRRRRRLVVFGATGYTGEDGFEIIFRRRMSRDAWNRLLAQGVAPAGLGARDTLRLEAGMNLYGNDMDENSSSARVRSRLDGRLRARRSANSSAAKRSSGRSASGGRELVGLLLEDRGVLRSHQKVLSAGDTRAPLA